MPSASAIPAGCSLAPDVEFDIFSQDGTKVGHVKTDASGKVVFFVQPEWGVITVIETANPATPGDDYDAVRFEIDVDFRCACQYPNSGGVNVVPAQE